MFSIQVDNHKLKTVCAKYEVDSLSVFGSFARDEARLDSDLDLLVSFSRRVSLLRLVALERELTQLFGREVDLLTEAALSPYLRDRILKERQMIYAT